MTIRTYNLLASFLETAPDAMILVRADGTIAHANRRAEVLFGLDDGDTLVGHVVEDLLPRALGERHRAYRDQYWDDPQPRAMGTGRDLKGRRFDGSEFSVDVSLGLIDVADEHLVAAALRDVTEQVRTQQALAASAFVLENSNDAVYQLDNDGVVTAWNHAAERLTGRHADEVLGTVTDAPLGLAAGFREAGLVDRARRGEHLDRYRCRLVRADGMVIPVSLSMAAIRDEHGRVVGTSGIARDITEEVTAQDALSDIQQRLVETQQLAHMGLWVYDVDADEMQWSEGLYDITGVSPLDFGGDLASHLAVVADSERERVAKEMANSIERGVPLQLEYPVIDADGDRRWFLTRAVADTDDDGRVIALQGICQDLTERQRLVEALQEADRLKDEFLATISHELRTPLTSIVGFAHILREHVDGETANWVDVIIRNGDEMHGMVERILDFSRLQGGRLGLSVSPQPAAALVTSVQPLVAAALAGHEFVVDVDPDAVVLADPNAMMRILVNLLTNAAKFSDDGSVIRLEVVRRDDGVCFRVTDEGAGIPADQLESIFERFHQVMVNPLTAKRGVGVGLSIVKGYAEAMGGHVTVQSEPGAGSRFEVWLPGAPR